MRALSVALVAGAAVAQVINQAPAQNANAPFPFPLAANPGQAQPVPQVAQVQATSVAAPAATVTGAQVKGLPVITGAGLTDSDIACARGDFSLCGLPNIPSIVNPNARLRYQTQASDQAITSLFQTGQLAADGRRVAGTVPGTNVLPYWTTNSPFGANVQGTVTVGAGDASRTPLSVNIQAITGDPSAPNAVTPSASNAYLPQSVAYNFANAFPQFTTAPNALTSAGIGYSTGINTQLGQTNVPQPVVNFGGVWGARSPQVWTGAPVVQPQWTGLSPVQWNAPAAPVSTWNAAPVSWNLPATQWNVPASTPTWAAPGVTSFPATNWIGGSTIGAPAWGNQFVGAPAVSWTTPAGTNGVLTNPGSFATAWNAPNAQAVNFAANAAPNVPGTTLTTAPAWVPATPIGVPAQAGQM